MTRKAVSPSPSTLAERIAARAELEDDVVPMPDSVIERVAAMLRPVPALAADDVSDGGRAQA